MAGLPDSHLKHLRERRVRLVSRFVKAWEWILLAVTIGFVVTLLLGPKLRALVSRVPEFWASCVFALAGGLLANAITAVTEIQDMSVKAMVDALYKERWLSVFGLVLLVIAAVNVYTRRQHIRGLEEEHEKALDELRAQHETDLKQLTEAHRVEWMQFIGVDLVRTLVAYGRALLERDPAKRNEEVRHAQKATIWMVSRYVGKTAGRGTRSCLYRVNAAEHQLVPIDGFNWGGEPCRRIFGANHTTYREIMHNRPVVEEGISDALADQQNLTYRSYIAYPVSVRRDEIYGALMVDCPNAGDLDREVDGAKVAVLAALLSATFYVLKNPQQGKTHEQG
jgi:hypothetical protein